MAAILDEPSTPVKPTEVTHASSHGHSQQPLSTVASSPHSALYVLQLATCRPGPTARLRTLATGRARTAPSLSRASVKLQGLQPNKAINSWAPMLLLLKRVCAAVGDAQARPNGQADDTGDKQGTHGPFIEQAPVKHQGLQPKEASSPQAQAFFAEADQRLADMDRVLPKALHL